MARKKPEKKILLLEPSFSQVLACRRKELRPFFEIIIQEGENISQQGLGTILGILEINDESEDSSYIVNYLVSIIKKEFFSKEKRGAIESFESALHKANLALSKLAQHENINWVGKFNALIAIIEKNNLHFSQAGKASLLLLRNNMLSDISEGMSEEDSPNPLKTFTSLSSGKLEDNDKLILVTPEIYEIFSLEEIKKSAIRFSKADFAQFLKTALENELEKAVSLIIDIHEKEVLQEKKADIKNEYQELNAFSQKAFVSKNKEKKKEIISSEEISAMDKASSEGTYGHIYIKEDPFDSPKKYFEKKPFSIKEFTKQYSAKLKQLFSLNNLPTQAKEKIKKSIRNINFAEIKNNSINNIQRASTNLITEIIRLLKLFFSKTSQLFSSFQLKKGAMPTISPAKIRILPSFSAIKEKMAILTRKQKIYAVILLFLIFIFPFFVIKIENYLKNSRSEDNSSQLATHENFSPPEFQNPTIPEIKDFSVLVSDSNILGIINLNSSFFAVKKDAIIQISDQKSWPVPESFGEIHKFTPMNDLNLIFIINRDKKILSFSPTSQKFQDNAFNLPDNSEITALGTFMTYLYVLDSKNNQIYRYPRAEGGFGEKTNWLKAADNLSGYENMAITDSIYIWKKENLIKFFRGKKENLSFEKIQPEINFSSIFANENSIYVLDKNNGTMVHFDMSGKIVSQVHSERIKTANGLAVSDDGKSFYLTSPDDVSSFSIL